MLGESQWAAVARAIGNGRTDSACRKQWERLYRVEQQQQHKRLRGDAEQLEDRASPDAAANGAAASALPAALPALPPADGAAGRGA